MADIKAKRISDLSPKTDITPDAKLPIIDKTAGGSYDNFNMPVALLTTLAKGDAGQVGPVGPQGPQGEPGPIPLVKSPNAPSDTDLLWIDTDDDGSMFIGPQGQIGPKGEKGDTGPVGPVGPQGQKGEKGDTGAPGTTDYNELVNTPDLTLKADKADTYTKSEVDTKDTTIATTAQSNLTAHASNINNPHSVNKAQVGLGNVSNLAPADMPVSTATQTALNAKANASDTVNLTGDQTVAGVKTFSSSPVVPTATTNTQAVNKAQMDTADALKMDKAGGTFSGSITAANLSGTNTGDNLFIGTTPPTPSIGAQVLWLDTTGGNITLNLVIGE